MDAEGGGFEVDRLLEREGDDGGVVELDELRQLSKVLRLLRHLTSHIPGHTHNVQLQQLCPRGQAALQRNLRPGLGASGEAGGPRHAHGSCGSSFAADVRSGAVVVVAPACKHHMSVAAVQG